MGGLSALRKPHRTAATSTPQAHPQPAPTLRLTGRPDIAQLLCGAYSALGGWLKPHQQPLVYSPNYNVRFFGIEKLHPFDSCKFEKVLAALLKRKLVQSKQVCQAAEVSMEMLRDVHSEAYLHELHTSRQKVAQVCELPPLALLPMFMLNQRVLRPFRFHAGGTMLAAALSFERGWAISLGGGMHHAHHDDASGWCCYDDHTLAVRMLRRASNGRVRRVLYIDTDAHQGNGVERDKLHFQDAELDIIDVYNYRNFPADTPAKRAIDIDVSLSPGADDAAYLAQLDAALQRAAAELQPPDLIMYNAGTDVLESDPLGQLGVSADGIVARDQRVWEFAAQTGSPICMVLSGGYASGSADVITRSIANLYNVFGLGQGSVAETTRASAS